MDDAKVGLRERTRRAVRGEITAAAMGLFLERGFDATTVDEIARAAGISRRSFFRYFTSKDEALSEALAGVGETVAAELAQRPADEAPWTALRRSFDSLIVRAESDPNAGAISRLMLERPDLRRSKDVSWQNGIADSLSRREPDEGSDSLLRCEALAAAAIACLNTAQGQWLESDEVRPLGTLLDIAMDAVRPL